MRTASELLGRITHVLGLGGLILVAGCGAATPMAVAPSTGSQASTASPALDRSLFGRDLVGSIGEQDLQRILGARLDIEMPMRVGVVALETSFDPEKRASIASQAVVAKVLTRGLKGSQHFSAVTDVSTDLPNPSGIEGLRVIAARYRTRYLLLCNAITEDRSHLNNWAWLYPTVVGFFVLPGKTVASEGLLQASLLDVKSGTVLFTVREPFQSASATWLIGSAREHSAVDGEAITEAAEKLSKKIASETEELATWSRAERAQTAENAPNAH